MNSELITICIPTRNRSGFLLKAVQSALAQTYPHIEIVVSDNASTDDTALRMQEIDDPRLVFLKQTENLGMIGNFNACLKAAKGSLFLLLSDDDLLEPEAIETLSRPFLQGSDGRPDDSIGLTWCPCIIINRNGEALWTTDVGPVIESSASFVMEYFSGTRGPRLCSFMWRTADVLAVGGFDGERYGALCDLGSLAPAALRHQSVACLSRPVVKNMMHASSSTSRGTCRVWLVWGETLYSDLHDKLSERGVSEKDLLAMKRNLLANLAVSVLLPNVGQPGWIPNTLREVARTWRNFMTPYVAGRVLRESWKIARVWQRERLA